MGQTVSTASTDEVGWEEKEKASTIPSEPSIPAGTLAPEGPFGPLQQFDLESKSGVGVHMFCFKHDVKPTIYIGSEVTDENDILNVKYQEWSKEYRASATPVIGHIGHIGGDNSEFLKPFKEPQSQLKVIWAPIHTFSSGRIAMVAVSALLNQGYEMKPCPP